jgi:histone arginine demethylase JMJD6
MKLRHFIRYLESNQDDSPLYVFDATFDEDRYAKRLLLDYTVPKFFDEDLFRLVGERRRPPYRWFLVGPQRSGTTVHIDPLGTSAWNTLIHGIKRWVLFPPHVSKSVVKGYKEILKGEDDEAIHYFTTILPRVKRRAASVAEAALAGSGGLGGYENFECYEFTQYAGETVFIPHGW